MSITFDILQKANGKQNWCSFCRYTPLNGDPVYHPRIIKSRTLHTPHAYNKRTHVLQARPDLQLSRVPQVCEGSRISAVDWWGSHQGNATWEASNFSTMALDLVYRDVSCPCLCDKAWLKTLISCFSSSILYLSVSRAFSSSSFSDTRWLASCFDLESSCRNEEVSSLSKLHSFSSIAQLAFESSSCCRSELLSFSSLSHLASIGSSSGATCWEKTRVRSEKATALHWEKKFWQLDEQLSWVKPSFKWKHTN